VLLPLLLSALHAENGSVENSRQGRICSARANWLISEELEQLYSTLVEYAMKVFFHH
jgi:hypothetical protein